MTNGDNVNEKTPLPTIPETDDQNPPPQRPQSQSVTVAVAARTPRRGGEEGSSSKSRKKVDAAGRPRSAPVFDGPETPPPCEVCSKVFPSWKSLFGHMRSHPERTWRGVKPPPVFTPPNSPKPSEPPQEESGADDGTAARGEVADFDLNDPMEEEVTPAPSPKRQRTFDLNMMPAPEEEDDE